MNRFTKKTHIAATFEGVECDIRRFNVHSEQIVLDHLPHQIPDTSWVYRDKAGHLHRYNAEGVLPLALWVELYEDDSEYCTYSNQHCVLCDEVLAPTTKPGPTSTVMEGQSHVLFDIKMLNGDIRRGEAGDLVFKEANGTIHTYPCYVEELKFDCQGVIEAHLTQVGAETITKPAQEGEQ